MSSISQEEQAANDVAALATAADARVVPERRAPRRTRPVRTAPAAIVELGSMVDLTLRAGRASLRRPFDWTPEFVSQLRFTIRICFLPLVLTSFALSFGPAGIQASNFFALVGATDRLGGAYVIIVVRLFAPLVSAIVIAGAAGTAICADLGARKARGELDALAVLGVDTVRSLVVPRLLALIASAFLFNIFALVAGLVGLVVVVLQNGGSLGPVFSTFFANANPLELQAAVLKTVLYGTFIAIICCHKGMTAGNDAQAVGRAVNRAVVLSFLAIGFTDYVFSQLLLATHPELSQVRG